MSSSFSPIHSKICERLFPPLRCKVYIWASYLQAHVAQILFWGTSLLSASRKLALIYRHSCSMTDTGFPFNRQNASHLGFVFPKSSSGPVHGLEDPLLANVSGISLARVPLCLDTYASVNLLWLTRVIKIFMHYQTNFKLIQ